MRARVVNDAPEMRDRRLPLSRARRAAEHRRLRDRLLLTAADEATTNQKQKDGLPSELHPGLVGSGQRRGWAKMAIKLGQLGDDPSRRSPGRPADLGVKSPWLGALT